MRYCSGFYSSGAVVLMVALIAVCTACNDTSSREERTIRIVTPSLAPVIEGNNAFALDLYREVAINEPGNLFLSPFSISSVLGMTYAGAQGDTAAQMESVLHISAQDEPFHSHLGALTRDLHGDKGRGYTLRIANRLFGQRGFGFEDPFVELVRDAYGAGLQELDFQNAPDIARQSINGWVADETENVIPNLFDSNAINTDTRLALANAIYFKGTWAVPFSSQNTSMHQFVRSNGEAVRTNIMRGTGYQHRIAYFEGGSAAELSYRDDELSMLILLPGSGRLLAELESNLTLEWLDGVIAQLENPGKLHVGLPSWEAKHSTHLTDVLETMGMTDAFDVDRANLNGISTEQKLYIQAMVHETYVKVDEQGTVAVAATGGSVNGTISETGTFFEATRSFVYIIRDRLTGSLLFIGRLEDPTAG